MAGVLLQRGGIMDKYNKQKLFLVVTVNLSCLCLSVLPVSPVFGEEVTSVEINSYIEKLGSDNEFGKALLTLRNIGSKAVPDLIKALKHKNPQIRAYAASALGTIGKKEAALVIVPALTQALNDTQTLENDELQVRLFAASALGAIGEKAASAVPSLVKLLTDQDPQMRVSAATALGFIGKTAVSAVPNLTKTLKTDPNSKVRSSATFALWMIGKQAPSAVVPVLTKALKDEKAEVRSLAALSLGKIGFPAASAFPELTQALKENQSSQIDGVLTSVGDNANKGLAGIAEGYQDNASKLSTKELEKAISNLESTLKVSDDLKDKFTEEEKAPLRRSLAFLKKEKQSRLFNEILNLITKHPWAAGTLIYILLMPSICITLLQLRPLWLLGINDVLKPYTDFTLPASVGGMKLPLRFVLFFGFFHYHPRVLDAWVAARINAAKEGFSKKKTVTERSVYIPISVVLDGINLANITATDLQPIFNKQRATLLIWGEGGTGKTSFACQLAKWAMSEKLNERLCTHQMLPILLENELDAYANSEMLNITSLQKAICGQLQALISEAEPVDTELVTHLLRQRRILVIADHLSEMSNATRNLIRPADTDFSVNALIVTSRLEEKLDDIPKTTMKPLRIEGNRLSSFMEAYLTYRDKRDLFTDTEYFDACRRLSLMVGQRNITALLAKLYAEQMIASKEGIAVDLPNNIPDLMLAYLNELNRNKAENEPDNRTVQRDAKVIAWECLKRTFRSTTAKLEDVLTALDDQDTIQTRLEYLEKRLRLLQIMGAAQDKIRFTLDPLAEYLAALHLIDCYGSDETAWRNFLAQADSIPDLEATKGFLLAVQDCCLAIGTEVNIPNFVTSELAKKMCLTA